MLPSLKQRVILVVAIAIGAWCLLLALPALRRADLGPGLSLLLAAPGPVMALIYLLLAGVPAVCLGMVASGAAHPLAGVFSVTFALAVLATAGGGVDGVLWQADSPRVYLALAAETLLWAGMLVGVLAVLARSRLWIRRRFPRLTTEHHFGTSTRLRMPNLDAALSGLITATAGGLVSWVLLKSTDPGQVFGALTLGFMLGALVSHQVIAQSNVTAVLLSPCLVGLVTYAYTAFRYGSHDAMMLAAHAGDLPGLARALPIHYASAGVAGCVLGVTLAQAIEHARVAEATA